MRGKGGARNIARRSLMNEVGKDFSSDGNVSLCDGALTGATGKLGKSERKKPWVEGQRMKMEEINNVQDRIIGSTFNGKNA